MHKYFFAFFTLLFCTSKMQAHSRVSPKSYAHYFIRRLLRDISPINITRYVGGVEMRLEYVHDTVMRVAGAYNNDTLVAHVYHDGKIMVQNVMFSNTELKKLHHGIIIHKDGYRVQLQNHKHNYYRMTVV